MLGLLLESAIRSLVLGAIAWAGLKLLRVRDPQIGMTVWTVVLIASLSMPLTMKFATVAIPAPVPHMAFFTHIDTQLAPPDANPPPGAADADKGVAPGHPGNVIDWSAVAIGVSLTVGGAMLARLLIGIGLIWRLWRLARPVTEDWAGGAHVRLSEGVPAPVTFGSAILLPADAGAWPPEKRRAVMLHERAHVANGDFYRLPASIARSSGSTRSPGGCGAD